MTPEEARRLTEHLKLFAQPQRLMILAQLLNGPCAVGLLESSTGIGQPTLSQQLGILRRAGILRTERESRTIVYRFADVQGENWLRSLLGMWNTQPHEEITSSVKTSSNHRGGVEEAGAVFAWVGPAGGRE
ncbi:MAG: metalloregulator ArsR/SmtB family transcription factor [Acetobacter sp.]|jgi:DNA-binding transcriptional ArsR family regulator|nr:metalloregulator ArsR/SmtB family transcription factor [Acetobacter sp.]MCH4091985.1 metalloregulator ArsR/SmtB family transcription factor [Acetobacter sp.]MCI1301095.1 metalloregulator ArsR/SmtB family transcription factor [Acetobacter sp.]MCI1317288.1 metalloregulator ArsR/SmtB family transcription factor [Acetobacter sp.]